MSKVFFDKGWSRKSSDKVTFERRHEYKEGVNRGALGIFMEVAGMHVAGGKWR